MADGNPFQAERNLVRSLDFLEWASRENYVRDVVGSAALSRDKSQDLIDVKVPDGHTWYKVQALHTCLGTTTGVFDIMLTVPGSSEAATGIPVAVPPETSALHGIVRRKIVTGTRYRSILRPAAGAKAGDTFHTSMTFIQLPWIE